jgi:hypothetical protein
LTDQRRVDTFFKAIVIFNALDAHDFKLTSDRPEEKGARMFVQQEREVSERIRVAVVDNHTLFRDGVVTTVNDTTDFEVVAEGQSGSDAVRIARDHHPDIMLLDANMPVSASRPLAKFQNAVQP